MKNGVKSVPLIISLVLTGSAMACSNHDPSLSGGSSVSSNQKTNDKELNRQTALALAKRVVDKPVSIKLERTPSSHLEEELYNTLIAANAISCSPGRTLPTDRGTMVYQEGPCECVPKSSAFTKNGDYLILVLGHKSPAEVTGISKIDSYSAIADVVLSFQRSAGLNLYQQYQGYFIKVMTNVRVGPVYTGPPLLDSSGHYVSLDEAMRSEQHRITFRLFDDGWRAATID